MREREPLGMLDEFPPINAAGEPAEIVLLEIEPPVAGKKPAPKKKPTPPPKPPNKQKDKDNRRKMPRPNRRS